MGTWELFQSVVFRQYNELESKNTSFQSVYYIVAMNYIIGCLDFSTAPIVIHFWIRISSLINVCNKYFS